MKKIFISANTSADAANCFGSGFEVTTDKTEAHIVLVRSGSIDFKDFPLCEAVGRLGKGVDAELLKEATERKIPVFFAGNANAKSVAQMVLAMTLSVLRDVSAARFFTQQLGIGPEALTKADNQKSRFLGQEIGPGLSVGILGGCGDIGDAVMKIFLGLNAQINLFDKIDRLKPFDVPMSVRKIYILSALISDSDVITSHVSTKDTLIDKKMFELAREGSVFLDFARGTTYSIEGLRWALANRKITYVTDFPTPEALQLQKDFCTQVFCLPHVGANTKESEHACMKMIADVLKAYFVGGEVQNCVNPEVIKTATV